MNPSTEQWKLLLSSVLSAAVFAIPSISKPLVFLLLTLLYGILIRLILSIVFVLFCLIEKPTLLPLWVFPIPLSLILMVGMFAGNGWDRTLLRLSSIGKGVTKACEFLLHPYALLIMVPCLIALGFLEHRALSKR
jgi:hypothetical protein